MYRDHEPSKNVQQEQKKHCCANCDIEFLWPPTIVRGKTYCCTGCANGGPCCCDYSQYNAVNISGIRNPTVKEDHPTPTTHRGTPTSSP